MQMAKVADASSLQPGQMTKAEVNGEATLLANIGGKYYAIHDVCTHKGCSLHKGRLNGTVVTCPCHGSQFDVTTGEVVHGPAKKPEKAYKVKVEDGAVEIEE